MNFIMNTCLMQWGITPQTRQRGLVGKADVSVPKHPFNPAQQTSQRVTRSSQGSATDRSKKLPFQPFFTLSITSVLPCASMCGTPDCDSDTLPARVSDAGDDDK